MLHLINQAYEVAAPMLDGPVKIEETFVGGKEQNRQADRQSKLPQPTGNTLLPSMGHPQKVGEHTIAINGPPPESRGTYYCHQWATPVGWDCISYIAATRLCKPGT